MEWVTLLLPRAPALIRTRFKMAQASPVMRGVGSRVWMSALAALVSEVEQAWNAHDISRFAACFAEDADFVNVRGWWWRGVGRSSRITLYSTKRSSATAPWA